MQQCGDCLKVYDESEEVACPHCDAEDECIKDDGDIEEMIPCPDCEGTGKEECYECEGEGGNENENCKVCDGYGDVECSKCEGDCHVYQNMETGEIRRIGF